MKKILVLGLLGVCCLNGKVGALGERGVDLARRQEAISVLVQEDLDGVWIPTPLTELKAASRRGVKLKGLGETSAKAAFIALHQNMTRGDFIPEQPEHELITRITCSPLTREELQCLLKLRRLLRAKFESLTIDDCEIKESNISFLIEALDRHQSLVNFELRERDDQKISDKGLLDLYEALVKLPVLLAASPIPERPGLRDVYTAFQDLLHARHMMLSAGGEYIRCPIKLLADKYTKFKGDVQAQTMRVNAEIAAARARFLQ